MKHLDIGLKCFLIETCLSVGCPKFPSHIYRYICIDNPLQILFQIENGRIWKSPVFIIDPEIQKCAGLPFKTARFFCDLQCLMEKRYRFVKRSLLQKSGYCPVEIKYPFTLLCGR